MHEHEPGEATTTAGGATAKDAAPAPTPAEQVVRDAAGDPHAFAHALAALEPRERTAALAAAHKLAGNAFVAQALLDQKYANAKASYVVRAGGKDVMVFLPPKGLPAGGAVNVFMFFHGMGGDYAAAKGVTDARSDTGHDNAALAADIPGAIAAAGDTIGVCPAGGANPWNDVKPGQYRAMLEETLAQLAQELGTPPLTVGRVSLAGHSAGGKALGGAATEIDATALNVSDVTLEDAGYNFDSYQASWRGLREWFCLGDAPKTLRVITKDRAGGTHGVVEQGRQFAADGIAAFAKERGLNLTTTPVAGDATVREGGMTLLGGLDLHKDGAPQGRLRIFGVAVADSLPGDAAAGKDPVAHWKVRNRSMKAAVLAGADADHFGTAAQPGPYRVLHSKAPVLDADLRPITGQALTQGTAVQVTAHKVEGDVAYAEVAGHGWVQLAYLEPAPAAPP